jgi:CRISPR-associated endonuclease/helicase Cas3
LFGELISPWLMIKPDDHPVLEILSQQTSMSNAELFTEAALQSTRENHDHADWMTCNASDLLESDAISQLQTTRRDYHPINVRGLISSTTKEHLMRTWFEPWDYADPIDGVSLHLEPREDRRHAYQWHKPSGDPTRSVSGGMMGANRLAIEAWPLFQSIAVGERLRTVGFHGTRANDTRFRWGLWSRAIHLDCVRSLLTHPAIHANNANSHDSVARQAIGVPVVFSCSKILVGKTPNLTPAEPV